MRFSSWYPAEQIPTRAPARAGVFQIRAAGLLDYPSGRSAMVHYGADEDLRAALEAWAAAHGREGFLYRHADELGGKTPGEQLQRLLSRFEGRFGAAPGSGSTP